LATFSILVSDFLDFCSAGVITLKQILLQAIFRTLQYWGYNPAVVLTTGTQGYNSEALHKNMPT
jgi:hypothetical protein